MSLYVASYDISDDLGRERVARVLLSFGHRVQRSVFQLVLEPDEIEELQFRVAVHLSRDDEFVLYPVDERGTRTILSWQRPVDELPAVVML
ncbi:MAG: CRISPR-associated endonuclease Cas2 [Planctomycetota bacterium]